jgi:hypothetical protein
MVAWVPRSGGKNQRGRKIQAIENKRFKIPENKFATLVSGFSQEDSFGRSNLGLRSAIVETI